jgi:hypothetical protein
MGKIGGSRLVAARISNIKPAQAIDDQGGVGRFIDDGEKLEECLFERGKFLVLVEKAGGFHSWFRSWA